MSPPSRRTALIPRSRPSASTSGPPEEPRGSGAVCSTAPSMRRPRGQPEAAPGGRHEAERDPQAATARVRQREHRACRCRAPRPAPSSRARCPRCPRSAPRGRGRGRRPRRAPVTRRPSAKATVTSSPRRPWAQVSTLPGSITTPDPSAQPRPRPTTAGPDALGGLRDRLLHLRQVRHLSLHTHLLVASDYHTEARAPTISDRARARRLTPGSGPRQRRRSLGPAAGGGAARRSAALRGPAGGPLGASRPTC